MCVCVFGCFHVFLFVRKILTLSRSFSASFGMLIFSHFLWKMFACLVDIICYIESCEVLSVLFSDYFGVSSHLDAFPNVPIKWITFCVRVCFNLYTYKIHACACVRVNVSTTISILCRFCFESPTNQPHSIWPFIISSYIWINDKLVFTSCFLWVWHFSSYSDDHLSRHVGVDGLKLICHQNKHISPSSYCFLYAINVYIE